MTATEFSDLLNDRIDRMKAVLDAKADEYAKEHDRLHNFKQGAAAQGRTPAQTCLSYMTKHWCSVVDLVDDDAEGFHDRVLKRLDEKIGDLVNYVVLLEAVLLESARAASTKNA